MELIESEYGIGVGERARGNVTHVSLLTIADPIVLLDFRRLACRCWPGSGGLHREREVCVCRRKEGIGAFSATKVRKSPQLVGHILVGSGEDNNASQIS